LPSPIAPVLAAAWIASTDACPPGRIRTDDLDLDLGHHVGAVLGAAVDLGLALLAAKALHFGHGHARHADLGERFADLVQLERLYDGDDEFHFAPFGGCPGGLQFSKGRAIRRNPAIPWLFAQSNITER
jgi:hypothetical protein